MLKTSSMKNLSYSRFDIIENFSKPKESNLIETYDCDGFRISKSKNDPLHLKFRFFIPYSYEVLKGCLTSPENFNNNVKESNIICKLGGGKYILEEIITSKIGKKEVKDKFRFICVVHEPRIGKLQVLRKSISDTDSKDSSSLGNFDYFGISLKKQSEHNYLISGNLKFSKTDKISESDCEKFLFEYIKGFKNLNHAAEEMENHEINIMEGVNMIMPRIDASLMLSISEKYKIPDRKAILDSNYSLKSNTISRNSTKSNSLNTTKEETIFYKKFTTQTDLGETYGVVKGEVEVVSKSHFKKERDLIFIILKHVGKYIFQGKSMINISMPIEVNTTVSMLEYNMENLRPLPNIAEKMFHAEKDVDKLNYLIGFVISFAIVIFPEGEPFNPILGETHQAYIDDTIFQAEQICHHPPITAFIMDNKYFRFSGTINPELVCYPNSFEGTDRFSGTLTLKNEKRQKYRMTMPLYGGTGLFFGRKRLMSYGMIPVSCETDGMVATIELFKSKNNISDYFETQIYKIQKEGLLNIEYDNKNFKGINKSQIIEHLGEGNGIFHSHYDYKGKRFWDVNTKVNCELRILKNPLPSDSRYRIDSIVWKTGNSSEAQKAKETLENIQRRDRVLRADYHKRTK